LKLGNNENKKRKKDLPKASKKRKKKERQKISKFCKAQKCNERLMYKRKGVEPNSKIEVNKRYKQEAFEVLTQYNPQRLFVCLILSFISPLTPDHVTSPIKAMWIKE